MINILKSDFYKLFRMKSFYICGILATILSALNILLTFFNLNLNYGEYAAQIAKLYGCSGFWGFQMGLSSAPLFFIILISIFVSSEFSHGTIKNTLSVGNSRTSVYFSKLITSISAVIMYSLICAVVSCIIGTAFWGFGEDITRSEYLDLLRMMGLYYLAELARISLFVMIGFLLRNTGATIAMNLLLAMGVADIIVSLINKLINNIPSVDNFDLKKYLPSTYCSNFLSLSISKETLVTGLIVCVSSIVLFSTLGWFIFKKRDIN